MLNVDRSNSADMFSFCKTFLTDKTETKYFSIPDYINIIRKERVRSAGGDMVVYVKDSILFIRPRK